jgi:hypothetical protein
MTALFYPSIHLEKGFKMVALLTIFLFYGCVKYTCTDLHPLTQPVPLDDTEGACIDVDGIVFGDILSHSNVTLYRTTNLNYTVVMTTVRTQKPLKWTLVNETSGFVFRCLSVGNYVAVIPASSFNQSVGSPLPYEFDCQNFSLSIAFHGGDSDFLVGVFSILNTSVQNKTDGCSDPFLCTKKKGSLYRWCHQKLL